MIDHFGALAPFYDRLIRPSKPSKLISLVGLPITGAVLDAGGGTGRIAQSFYGLALPIVVADLSLGMLHQASRKNGLEPVCSLTEKLPFRSEFFDRVVMVDALHHVSDHRETAQELWRVLKKGGRLVIEEPDIRNKAVKLVALAEKLALMRSHFIPPEKIQRLFPYADAQAQIELEGHIAWVVIDKL